MNWECRLSAAVRDPDESLVPGAHEARDLCKQKRYGQALDTLWHMLRSAQARGSRQQEAFVLIHIGKIYRHFLPEIALKFYREGLAAARSCGFERGEMIAYNAMGEMYYAQGQPDRALEYYTRSLHAARDLGDPASQRDVLLDMVDCYEERGEFSRCDQLLEEATLLDQAMGAR